MSHISKIIAVTFIVVIIFTTTLVPNTIMEEANIEETQEAVASNVRVTTLQFCSRDAVTWLKAKSFFVCLSLPKTLCRS